MLIFPSPEWSTGGGDKVTLTGSGLARAASPGPRGSAAGMSQPRSKLLSMAKSGRVLAALRRDGWIETRRSGSHRVLVEGDQQRVWAYHDRVDLGGPAMARIARDYGYTVAELRKL